MAESIIEMIQQLRNGNQHQAFSHVVDIPEWTIFEVPAVLRATSPASFQNKGLELGLHHRTLKKSQTEVFKFELARIIDLKLAANQSSWGQFAEVVVGDVSRARRAFSSESAARFSDEEIRTLLAVDALFFVVLFKYVNGKGLFLKEFEAMAGRIREILLVIDKTDFFLIENQVPMYLLQSAIRQLCEIDEETQAERALDPNFRIELKVEDELEKVLNEAIVHLNPFTFPDLSARNVSLFACLSCFCSRQLESQNIKSRDGLHRHLIKTYPVEPLEKSLINCQHLLDCLYRVICGHSLPFKVEEGVESTSPLEDIPSATRLEAVGIRATGSVLTLKDVRLSGTGYLRSARLKLPKVILNESSQPAFHNLALHEQLASGGLCGDFRCYLQCMASLCVTVSDLQLLSENGVITNHLGNDALIGMWDRSLKGITTPFSSSTWVRCYHDIRRHRDSALKRWRKECWTLFFAKPWTVVSVLAGIILLFLTATQTYFTAFPPSKN